MKQAHNSSSISKVLSDIILSIPTASLVPFRLLNPNSSSQITFSVSLSIHLPSSPATIFAVCAMRPIVQWSLYFVAFIFFLKALIVT